MQLEIVLEDCLELNIWLQLYIQYLPVVHMQLLYFGNIQLNLAYYLQDKHRWLQYNKQ